MFFCVCAPRITVGFAHTRQVLPTPEPNPSTSPTLLIICFFLSSSPGTWDKSCSVPPSTRQTTWPLLYSVTWTQAHPGAVTTSLSVEGERNRLESTCTWKQQASWSNSKGHSLSGFFFFFNTLGTVVISHMVLEMVGLCDIWSVLVVVWALGEVAGRGWALLTNFPL